MDTIVTPEIVSDLPAPRDLRIDQANALYTYSQAEEHAAATHARNAIMAGLQLGYLLTQLKDETPRGQWSLLFSDASKRVQAPNALMVKSANGSHENHFTFASSTARKYMTCYKAACLRLEAESTDGRDQLIRALAAPGTDTAAAGTSTPSPAPGTSSPAPAATDLSDTSPLRQLLDRATDNAETPRQMMLHFGIIKAPAPKFAPTPTGLAAHETILTNRNRQGAPAKAPATPEQTDQAIAAAITSTPSEDMLAERAAKDAHYVLNLLKTIVADGLCAYLTRDERKYIADQLRDYAAQITK